MQYWSPFMNIEPTTKLLVERKADVKYKNNEKPKNFASHRPVSLPSYISKIFKKLFTLT